LCVDGAPTSVDFIRDEPNRMVAAYNSAHCIVYDLESGKPVVRLETSQVKKFVLLPNMRKILMPVEGLCIVLYCMVKNM
jgi:striatin 1/3/4